MSSEVVAGARAAESIRSLIGTEEAPIVHPRMTAALSGNGLLAPPHMCRAVGEATTTWTAAQREGIRQLSLGQLTGTAAALLYPQLVELAVAYVAAEARELGQGVDAATMRQVAIDPARFQRVREMAAASRNLKPHTTTAAPTTPTPAPRPHPRPRAPPPFNGNCDNCGKWGHRARECRSKGRRTEDPKDTKPKGPKG